DTRSRGLDRGATRLRVRRDLGIPDHGRIVLGCGTVDFRKGADLFVQVARRCLGGDAQACPVPDTWFLWVGNSFDENLQRWLSHDRRQLCIQDRVSFLGERADTTAYFLAADLFLLTSREDPCPFAMLEAM